MPPKHTLLGKLLEDSGKITRKALDDALATQRIDKDRRLGEILLQVGALSQESLFETLSLQLGLPLVRLGNFDIDLTAIDLLPQDQVRQLRIMPLLHIDERLVVATADPNNIDTINQLAFISGHVIEPVLATPDDIELAIAVWYAPLDDKILVAQIEEMSVSPLNSAADVRHTEQLAHEKPTVRLVNNIILDAIQRRASDIHLCPREGSVELLFRIDGSLIPVRRFSRSLLPAIISRIKVISGLDISERRLPQDGRARVNSHNRIIDLRISIIPAINGESVVIRILDTAAGLKTLPEIGFNEHDAARLQLLLARSQGLLLVTGPTGSGKTTTLYAALQEVRRRAVNIITVEDPVEYHLDGVRQIQVNHAAGYTFARALRHILRHDPDVIMIGEIRDTETARIAVESALTGHIVLSTLHTNSAATTITRLLEIGIEPYLLNATLMGVLAQRLVKRNCTHCAAPEEVGNAVRLELGVGPDEQFVCGTGCSHCGGTGFHGRSAVYELLEVTPALRERIHAGVLEREIEETARAEGMTPLTTQALALARRGITPLSEVLRVHIT
ncbi:MAG: GspE/PulE family protein [Pseudomonadota bacterium]